MHDDPLRTARLILPTGRPDTVPGVSSAKDLLLLLVVQHATVCWQMKIVLVCTTFRGRADDICCCTAYPVCRGEGSRHAESAVSAGR